LNCLKTKADKYNEQSEKYTMFFFQTFDTFTPIFLQPQILMRNLYPV